MYRATSPHVLPSLSTRPLRALALGLAALVAGPALAQNATGPAVTGTVVTEDDGLGLAGVNVVAVRLAPDSARSGVVTDAEGRFRLALPDGAYRVRVSYVGFVTVERDVTVRGGPVTLGTVALTDDTVVLDEAVVQAQQERVTLRGDTTVFNADAYRVNPDATAEDLVGKLPGVVVEDGTVTAQGETVQRVLVDGEEFFGSDPTAALRNLPAEAIQEIEVYDRASEQARLTGFDDGNAQRTINIVTRPGMNNGQFGRVFGGYGPDGRYLAGASVNIFDGARRITLIGLANNVSQQNFAMEDLLGVLGEASGRQGGGGRGGRGDGPPRGGGGPPDGGNSDGPPRGGGGSDPGQYLVGAVDGRTTTSAMGVNYIDRWGADVRVNGSYFFNLTGNDADTRRDRTYFLDAGANQLYTETNTAESDNQNHRLALRIEAPLSERTELTVSPRLSVQGNTSTSLLTGQSALADGTALSRTSNDYTADNLGYTSATSISIRHRFPTERRTLSASFDVGLDGRNGDTEQDVTSVFYRATGDSTDTFQRQIGSDGWSRSLGVNLSYTEPLGERGMLQVSYAPTFARSAADQDAFRFDAATGGFTALDSAFTSTSDQRVTTQRGGLSYRYRAGRSFSASVGLDAQYEALTYDQGGPRAFSVDRSYTAFLPSAQVRAELAEALNLDLSYRASARSPGVNQLRNVVDDTNPLLITTGNPALTASRTHSLRARLRSIGGQGASMLAGTANLTFTQDYVGTATLTAGTDSLVAQGIVLEPGAQLSFPVNLDGYLNARASLTAARPLGFIRTNANLTGGASYTRTPALLNGVLNRADALTLDGRLSLASNISERLDFTLSYGLGWTTVGNTTTTTQDADYVRHRAGLRFNALPWGGLVLASNLDLSFYTGLSSSVRPTVARWDVGVGYKFLQNDVAEVRLTVNDLLNQDTDLSRTVTGTYVEDVQTDALGRYVMLNLTYRLGRFGR